MAGSAVYHAFCVKTVIYLKQATRPLLQQQSDILEITLHNVLLRAAVPACQDMFLTGVTPSLLLSHVQTGQLLQTRKAVRVPAHLQSATVQHTHTGCNVSRCNVRVEYSPSQQPWGRPR